MQSQSYVIRLSRGPAGGRMSGLPSRHGDEALTGLLGFAGVYQVLPEPHAFFQHLEVVESRVLAQYRVAQLAYQFVWIVIQRQIPVYDRAGFINGALAFETQRKVPEKLPPTRRHPIEPFIGRKPRGGNVEKSGLIDEHRAMEHSPRQLGGRRSARNLGQRCAISEMVQRRVPISEFVARGKSGDAKY